MPPAQGPRSGDNRPLSVNWMTCCSRDRMPRQALPEPLPPGALASLPRGWDTAYHSAADTRQPGRGLAEDQWVAALAHPSRTSREGVLGHWLQRQPTTPKAPTAGLLSPRSHSLVFSLPTANPTWDVLES